MSTPPSLPYYPVCKSYLTLLNISADSPSLTCSSLSTWAHPNSSPILMEYTNVIHRHLLITQHQDNWDWLTTLSVPMVYGSTPPCPPLQEMHPAFMEVPTQSLSSPLSLLSTGHWVVLSYLTPCHFSLVNYHSIPPSPYFSSPPKYSPSSSFPSFSLPLERRIHPLPLGKGECHKIYVSPSWNLPTLTPPSAPLHPPEI